MTALTPADLARIEELAEKATPGPWEEVWKQIPGFDGYEVSDHGRVRSYYRKGNFKDKRADYARTLKPAMSATGYPQISLPVEGGTYRKKSIHRLVMLAFRGPAPEGMEVAHLNGDKADARLENLAYVTHAENESHKVAHGTAPKGESNGQSRLLGWQVEEIRYLASMSVPQGKIAQLFDLPQNYVSEILYGDRWPDVSARDARVKAEAWDEGARWAFEEITGAPESRFGLAPGDNPHRKESAE